MAFVGRLDTNERPRRRILPVFAGWPGVYPTHGPCIVSIMADLINNKVQPFLVTKVFPGPNEAGGMSCHGCVLVSVKSRTADPSPALTVSPLIVVVSGHNPHHMIGTVA